MMMISHMNYFDVFWWYLWVKSLECPIQVCSHPFHDTIYGQILDDNDDHMSVMRIQVLNVHSQAKWWWSKSFWSYKMMTTFVSASLVTVQADIPGSLVLIKDKVPGTGDRGFESHILQVGRLMMMTMMMILMMMVKIMFLLITPAEVQGSDRWQ